MSYLDIVASFCRREAAAEKSIVFSSGIELWMGTKKIAHWTEREVIVSGGIFNKKECKLLKMLLCVAEASGIKVVEE